MNIITDRFVSDSRKSKIVKPSRWLIQKEHVAEPKQWDNLVGAYPFWGGAGTLLEDITEERNHGTFVGMDNSDWVRNNRGNWTLDFTVNSGYIDIGHQDHLGDQSTDKPISFVAWVFIDALGDDPRPFASTDSSEGANHAYYFGITGGQDFSLIFYDADGSNRIGKATSSNAPETEWTHFVGTYDGSGAESGITLYINGQEESTDSVSAGSYTATDGTGNWIFGARWIGSGAEEWFNGRIEDLRIYNRELTAVEVRKIFYDPYAYIRPRGFR